MLQVLAITGMMGSGKSTMAEQLHGMLPDSVVLAEDDFNPAPLRSLADIRNWWNRGGDVAEFDLSPLVSRIQSCVKGDSHFVGLSQPCLVLLETQFGRLHPQLKPWITCQCWIEVPADLALARKLAQLTRQLSATADAAAAHESLQWIAGFCDGYAETTRQLFQRQRQQMPPLADVVISGEDDPFEVCQQLWQALPASLRTQCVDHN